MPAGHLPPSDGISLQQTHKDSGGKSGATHCQRESHRLASRRSRRRQSRYATRTRAQQALANPPVRNLPLSVTAASFPPRNVTKLSLFQSTRALTMSGDMAGTSLLTGASSGRGPEF